MLEYLWIGILNVVTEPMNLLMLFLSIVIGYIGGAIPGLSGTMLIVILLPVTYSFEPAAAFILLTGIYSVTALSGAFGSILLRTPGTPEAIFTTYDGYPMAQQGYAGRALGITIISAVIGSLFGVFCLITLTPLLANVALSFSSPEYFALAFMGLTVVASLSGKDILKGLIGVLFGLMIATVGMDALTGTLRYTFNYTPLTSGIELIPVITGLFALSEFIKRSTESHNLGNAIKVVKTKLFEREIFKKIRGTIAGTSVIGMFIGILPGVGATTAAMLAYSETVRWSKKEEKDTFGKGNPKGIAASEAASNSAGIGTLVPLLSLGIPGGATAAILIGAFILHGMQPGPMLFNSDPILMYTIFAGLLISNILMLFLSTPFIKIFEKIIKVPYSVLGPLIVVLCLIGTYTLRNSFFDVIIMVIFGIIGYLLERFKFPLATIILGVVLGPIAESQFRRSVQMSDGDFSIFFTRPISLTLIVVSIIMLFLPIIMKYIRDRKVNKVDNSA
ncbi:tripartite tricarboxylate transporter permease [Oceanobacillus sp. CFH 90083]|uniref:tripartite tricarboxylate transporter permease n=1 Tax=Oceanobacillus sp. CFH 90083 TaxID=2592336 RepID=UPI00128D32C3|nr:tripartite tricarboxylate transporter permease [Oceanobacillus sp. CFH 90083]